MFSLLVLLGTGPAHADFVYTLSGGSYTPIVEADPPITGTITVDASSVISANIVADGIVGTFDQISLQQVYSPTQYALRLIDSADPSFVLTLLTCSPETPPVLS